MTSRPSTTVAVIVPAFNSAQFLAETLDSVRSQSFPDWECIVVDDGSTDSTMEIAARFASVDTRYRVLSQSNAGPHIARNAGLAAVSATVEWVALLDSDDVWIPDALDRLLQTASGRPDAVGVYGLAEYIDSTGRPLRPGAHPAAQQDRRRLGVLDLKAVSPSEDSSFDTLVVSGTIWPPAVGILRRDIVDTVGRFDPAQKLVEDWDLYLRMSRHGPFVPIARQVAWYRQHAQNLTKRGAEMAYFHTRVRWKLWASPANTPAQRRTAQRVWRRLHLRWIVWTVGEAVLAMRGRDRSTARAALLAALRFTRQFAVGHPTAADKPTVEAIVRFVIAHQNGQGLRDA